MTKFPATIPKTINIGLDTLNKEQITVLRATKQNPLNKYICNEYLLDSRSTFITAFLKTTILLILILINKENIDNNIVHIDNALKKRMIPSA